MQKRARNRIFYGGAAAVALVAALYLLTYRFEFQDPVSIGLKKTFPAYLSGSRFITVYDLGQSRKIAQRLNPNQSRTSIDDVLKQRLKTETLFRKLNLSIESDEISDELTYLTRGNEAEYKQILGDYFGGREDYFIKYVVYPSVVDKKLRLYYDKAYAAKEESSDRAYNALSAIKSGDKTFEELAKEQSDDAYTGQFGGDLGFFEHGQILPEIEKIAVISPLGKVIPSVIESRLGYHIVYPIEVSYSNGKKLWHIKHILFKTKGYDAWLKSNTEAIRIIRFKG